MKGTLKKIRGKAVAAFLCVCVVLVRMIPVNAAESRHVCIMEQQGSPTLVSYTQSDEENHMLTYITYWVCRGCNNKQAQYFYVYQPHSWAEYRDKGHVGENDHLYELYCALCKGTKTIRMTTCDGKVSGIHATPW